jgi:hypothetical protein
MFAEISEGEEPFPDIVSIEWLEEDNSKTEVAIDLQTNLLMFHSKHREHLVRSGAVCDGLCRLDASEAKDQLAPLYPSDCIIYTELPDDAIEKLRLCFALPCFCIFCR